MWVLGHAYIDANELADSDADQVVTSNVLSIQLTPSGWPVLPWHMQSRMLETATNKVCLLKDTVTPLVSSCRGHGR